MTSFETDLDILNSARQKVAYGGSTNSLVKWTLSKEWTTPTTRAFRSQAAVSGEITDKTAIRVLFKGGLLSTTKIESARIAGLPEALRTSRL